MTSLASALSKAVAIFVPWLRDFPAGIPTGHGTEIAGASAGNAKSRDSRETEGSGFLSSRASTMDIMDVMVPILMKNPALSQQLRHDLMWTLIYSWPKFNWN